MTQQQSDIINDQLPDGWIDTTLGEVISNGFCKIKNSYRQPLSSNMRLSMKGCYPYYGAASAIDFIDTYKLEGYHLLIAEDGTVTANGVNPMLQLVDGKFNVSNHAHILQGNQEWETKFLFYILSSINITPYITGAVQPKLTKENLLKINFLFPQDPKEQQAIASLLSSFDDKIELLREENKTLEQIGQTIFQEWFGKYSPDAPEELPEGWRIGKLGEVIENFDSQRIPIASDKRLQGIYPYYGATGINDYVEDFIFDGIYTLLGEDGSVIKENGKPFTQYVWGKIWVNNHAHVLQGRSGFSTELIKIILDNTDISPYVNGAVQLKVNQTNMNAIPVIIATENILQDFNKIVQPIFEKIRDNTEQIQSLSKVRDELLPKLMKGEVRVK